MLDYPRWEGDLAGKVFGKDIVQHQGLLCVLFKLGAVLRLFHTGSLHIVLFRRQRSAGLWQLVLTELVCLVLCKFVLFLCEKTIWFLSVGSLLVALHTCRPIPVK